MMKRQFVIDKVRETFERFGFEPLETPSIELWETLSGKYGEEADRLTYRFVDRGGREVGLRYDLTVPLSRVVALYPQIPKPFKRYQIQPVWRADKPQKGRFREFYQCDVDIVGSPSILADAEIIAVLHASLSTLGFKNYRIRINNRKILAGIAQVTGAGIEKELAMCRTIDKLDKIGLGGVREALLHMGLSAHVVERILGILNIDGTNQQRLDAVADALKENETGSEGIRELRELFGYLEQYRVPETCLQFDLYLSRGLDYYTGPIFETVVEEPRIGSITGGGRYDNLIGLFTGQSLPATGSSIGLERIVTVMDELGMFPPSLKTPIQVLVTVFDTTTLNYSIEIASLLRHQGFHVDLYTGKSSLRGQIGLANDKGIPVVVIAGPEEKERRKANVKNMVQGSQDTVSVDELSHHIEALLRTVRAGV